jgi:phosphoglycolate phosphatase
MAYQLLVFDWDGTLMDSEARIVACMQAAARDAGLAEPSRAAARDIIGLGLAEAIARLFDGHSPQAHARVVEGYRHHWLAGELAPSPLFEGARELIADLDRAGCMLAVATGKSRRGLDRVFEETGLAPHFVASRCADEAFSKPHPQMLLDILERVGADAADTLVIGDTEYDMQMAANAGADALGIAHGVHSPQRLLDSGALGCVNDLHALRTWLADKVA